MSLRENSSSSAMHRFSIEVTISASGAQKPSQKEAKRRKRGKGEGKRGRGREPTRVPGSVVWGAARGRQLGQERVEASLEHLQCQIQNAVGVQRKTPCRQPAMEGGENNKSVRRVGEGVVEGKNWGRGKTGAPTDEHQEVFLGGLRVPLTGRGGHAHLMQLFQDLAVALRGLAQQVVLALHVPARVVAADMHASRT